VLGRARRRVAVVDAGEPRNAPAAHMHGFLSRVGMPPAELLRLGRAEAAGYGVEFVSDARNIRVIEGEVRRLVVEDDVLKGVVLGDGRTVELAALFVRPEIRPRTAGLEQLACPVDAGGFFVVDATGATSVPGVWAAGNVTNPRAQVITAAGEGSAAAIAINADLVNEDVRG
jgi:thioredoxin reductase